MWDSVFGIRCPLYGISPGSFSSFSGCDNSCSGHVLDSSIKPFDCSICFTMVGNCLFEFYFFLLTLCYEVFIAKFSSPISLDALDLFRIGDLIS